MNSNWKARTVIILDFLCSQCGILYLLETEIESTRASNSAVIWLACERNTLFGSLRTRYVNQISKGPRRGPSSTRSGEETDPLVFSSISHNCLSTVRVDIACPFEWLNFIPATWIGFVYRADLLRNTFKFFNFKMYNGI